MKKITIILLLISIATSAQNIFRDDFSTYAANQQLSGQGTWTNNSAMAGGLGTCSGAGCVNAKVLGTAISYNGYGSSVNSVELKKDLDGCGTAFTPITSTTFYISMVINISSASVMNQATDFFRIMAGSNSNVPFRVTAMSMTSGFFNIGISKASGPVLYFSGVLAFNTNHLIVMKYIKNAGTADDAVAMFVNPSVSQGEPATADTGTTSGTDVIGNVDRFSFRQNAALGIPSGRAGLVSVSGSWLGLRFPTLATDDYVNTDFKINSSNINNGFIEINSDRNIDNGKIKIYDIQGKLLENKTISLTANENKVDCKPITTSGIYILEFTDDFNNKKTEKIIVK